MLYTLLFRKEIKSQLLVLVTNQTLYLHWPLRSAIIHVWEARFVVYVIKVYRMAGNLQNSLASNSCPLFSSPYLTTVDRKSCQQFFGQILW
jgi:hypothetical protein